MSILVTGASGFTGTHLANYLDEHLNERCIRTSRNPDENNSTITCDLADTAQVSKLIKTSQPEIIFHTAGSFTNTYETDFISNVVCAKNILDAIVEHSTTARVILMGSAAEYGAVTTRDNPVSEQHPASPISIYGWTKAAQSLLAPLYSNTHGIEVMVARTFNLLGNGMSDRLFTGRVERQIHAVLGGQQERITVGNLDAERDYINITRACELYIAIAQQGKAGEIYNVGSGKPTCMRDLMKDMLAAAGLDYSIVDESAREDLRLHNEVSIIYADIRKVSALVN